MDLLKNLVIFETELGSIELDFIEKPDSFNNNILSRFITASKYDKERQLYIQHTAQFENNIPLFPFSLPPEADTYMKYLDRLSTNVYKDFLLMELKPQNGVLERLKAFQSLLHRGHDKISKHCLLNEKFYSLYFFNDVFTFFEKIDNGIDWKDYLIEKEIADIITQAIDDRMEVLSILINYLQQIISADKPKLQKEKNANKVKKPSTKFIHQGKLDKIYDLVEKKWRNEKKRTIIIFEKIYKKAKGEYAKINKIDRSQLNRELKNTDGLDYVKKKIESIYGKIV